MLNYPIMERKNGTQQFTFNESISKLSPQELGVRITNLEKCLHSLPSSARAEILSRKNTLKLILSRKTNQIN